MARGFLPSALGSIGQSISIIADGDPIMKPGGMTIDWSTVAAISGADVTWLDNFIVPIGAKGLRYGQLMCEITGGETVVNTVTGTTTAGDFTYTVTNEAGVSATTAAIAYNATAATQTTAVEALANVGAGGVVITGTTTTGPFTLAFSQALGDVTVSVNGAGLTGGTMAVAVTASGARAGKFGPYDPAATDGRQLLVRGKAFWLPRSVREADFGSEYAPGLEGGRVFKERLIQSGTATHTLALGPTLAEVITLFTDLRFA